MRDSRVGAEVEREAEERAREAGGRQLAERQRTPANGDIKKNGRNKREEQGEKR
jgi:hypothetical protein